jgi:glutamate synthase domain-containing protein 1
MCGIAGLFSKDAAFEPLLGSELARMLVALGDRGPDSAGVALFGEPLADGRERVSLLAPAGGALDARDLTEALGDGAELLWSIADHVVVAVPDAAAAVDTIHGAFPALVVLGYGRTIELMKAVGPPSVLVERFALAGRSATHGLGHTRMATESFVTTEHSHPFSTGADLCLVHNGSISNHLRLRTKLERAGIRFATDNDSEVAAGFFAWRLALGDSLPEALERGIVELDGFYTFAVASADGFAVLRDPVACKPALLAETDGWVAMASELQAIADLPGAADARIVEPAAGRVYHWSREAGRLAVAA